MYKIPRRASRVGRNYCNWFIPFSAIEQDINMNIKQNNTITITILKSRIGKLVLLGAYSVCCENNFKVFTEPRLSVRLSVCQRAVFMNCNRQTVVIFLDFVFLQPLQNYVATTSTKLYIKLKIKETPIQNNVFSALSLKPYDATQAFCPVFLQLLISSSLEKYKSFLFSATHQRNRFWYVTISPQYIVLSDSSESSY